MTHTLPPPRNASRTQCCVNVHILRLFVPSDAPIGGRHDGAGKVDEDGDDEDLDADGDPPEVDGPDRWDEFGTEFESEESLPEAGDFWTEDDDEDG